MDIVTILIAVLVILAIAVLLYMISMASVRSSSSYEQQLEERLRALGEDPSKFAKDKKNKIKKPVKKPAVLEKLPKKKLEVQKKTILEEKEGDETAVILMPVINKVKNRRPMADKNELEKSYDATRKESLEDTTKAERSEKSMNKGNKPNSEKLMIKNKKQQQGNDKHENKIEMQNFERTTSKNDKQVFDKHVNKNEQQVSDKHVNKGEKQVFDKHMNKGEKQVSDKQVNKGEKQVSDKHVNKSEKQVLNKTMKKIEKSVTEKSPSKIERQISESEVIKVKKAQEVLSKKSKQDETKYDKINSDQKDMLKKKHSTPKDASDFLSRLKMNQLKPSELQAVSDALNVQNNGAIAALRRQVEEKEKMLRQEHQVMQAASVKVKEVQGMYETERQKFGTLQKQDAELMSRNKAEIASLHERMEHIHKSHAAEVHQLRSQLRQTGQNGQLQIKFQQLKEESVQLKQANEQEKNMINMMKDELQKTVCKLQMQEGQKKSLEAQLKQFEEQQNQLKTAKRDSENNLHARLAEMSDELRRVQIQQEQNMTINTQYKKIAIENEQMDQKMMALESELELLKKKNNELRTKNWKAMQALDDAEKRLKNVDGKRAINNNIHDGSNGHCVNINNREAAHGLDEGKTDEKLLCSLKVDREAFCTEKEKFEKDRELVAAEANQVKDEMKKLEIEKSNFEQEKLHLKTEQDSLIERGRLIEKEKENIDIERKELLLSQEKIIKEMKELEQNQHACLDERKALECEKQVIVEGKQASEELEKLKTLQDTLVTEKKLFEREQKDFEEKKQSLVKQTEELQHEKQKLAAVQASVVEETSLTEKKMEKLKSDFEKEFSLIEKSSKDLKEEMKQVELEKKTILDEIQLNIDTKKEQESKLNDVIAQLEKKLSETNANMQTMDQQLDKAAQDSLASSDILNSKDGEISKLRDIVKDYYTENEVLKNQLKNQVNGHQEKSDDLLQIKDEQIIELQKLNAELLALKKQAEVDSEPLNNKENNEELQALVHRIFPSSKPHTACSLDDWVEVFQQETQQLIAQALLKKESGTESENSAAVADLEAQVEHYKQVLAETEGMLSKLQSSVETEQQSWQDKVAAVEEEKRQVVKQLREISAEGDHDSQELVKARENLSELKGHLEVCDKKREALEGALSLKEKEYKELAAKSHPDWDIID